jgi:hypothetical protein
MPLLAAPILAQVLSLSAMDHAELRWVTLSHERYFEAEDRAQGVASLTWKHALLRADYMPDLLLTPLENPKPNFLQTGTGTAQVFWGTERTTYRLTEAASYSVRDLRTELYSAPAAAAPATATQGTPTGQQTPPGSNATGGMGGTTGTTGTTAKTPTAVIPSGRATTQVSRFWTEHADFNLTNAFSLRTSFIGTAAYDVNGGADRETRSQFPTIQAPSLLLELDRQLDRDNRWANVIDGFMAFGSNGQQSLLLRGIERMTHVFSARTTGILGAGAAVSRELKPEPQHRLDPVGEAEIVDVSPLAHGFLDLTAAATYSPLLDRLTVSLGPHAIFTGAITWVRVPWLLGANFSADFPVFPRRTAAVGTQTATATAAYSLRYGLSLQAGVRYAVQQYLGQSNVPPTATVFAAVEWRGLVERR